jgi:hypothetical protein
MILVIIGLILVGGRRLEHLSYLCEDPLVKRFCGLLRLPRERSVSRWLKRFTHKSLQALSKRVRKVPRRCRICV